MDSVVFRLEGADIINEVFICDLRISRDFVAGNEEHGVCARDLFGRDPGFAYTLGTTTEFIGEGVCPCGGVRSLEELVYVLFSPCYWVEHMIGSERRGRESVDCRLGKETVNA